MASFTAALGVTPTPASTTVDPASAGQRLQPYPIIITVASTAGFPAATPAAPQSFLTTSDEGPQRVLYTGIVGATFTGCTGGVGKLISGAPVTTPVLTSAQGGQQPSAPLIAVGFDVTALAGYVAGGDAFNPATQLATLGYDKAPYNIAVVSEKKLVAGHVYEWAYDRVGAKLFLIKDGAADAGTADQSAVGAIRVVIFAR